MLGLARGEDERVQGKGTVNVKVVEDVKGQGSRVKGGVVSRERTALDQCACSTARYQFQGSS